MLVQPKVSNLLLPTNAREIQMTYKPMSNNNGFFLSKLVLGWFVIEQLSTIFSLTSLPIQKVFISHIL